MGLRSILFYLGRRDTWPEPTAVADGPGNGATAAWLRSCQNRDGGFGVAPGLRSDMDSTFRAIDALVTLGSRPEDPDACVEWVLSCRNEDGGFAGEPRWHSNVAWTWFALRALEQLGAEPPDRGATVKWLLEACNEDGGNGASPVTGKLAYHAAWYSTCEYTSYKAEALAQLNAGQDQWPEMVDFLRGLQKEGAGFSHRGGAPATAYTLDALEGLAALGAEPADADACAAWLAGLRRDDGGYGWPGSGRSTLRNTAHCVLALTALGEEADVDGATTAYIRSCQNGDGGYGHAPGRASTVTDTWYAVKALAALNAID
jgi:hypothetical protein